MDSPDGPSMLAFILFPWICAVFILIIALFSKGSSWVWVVLPALIFCSVCSLLAWQMYKKSMQKYSAGPPDLTHGGEQSLVVFYVLCVLGGLAAFVVALFLYAHFLSPYNYLGGGATYLNMLPSQSAMAASDATAIVFQDGTDATFVDQNRVFGYVDARNPDGTMYCVAPVANKYTVLEPGVEFFAAGYNCCGTRGEFGCGQGLGALVLQREDNADAGFKAAVEGAAVEYGLMPGNGYLLLTMMADPMQYRQDKLDNAVMLVLIYALVYLLISGMVGWMAYNTAKK